MMLVFELMGFDRNNFVELYVCLVEFQGNWKLTSMKQSHRCSCSCEYGYQCVLEEEDLVNAHRRQVEETMDIVREEMSLLIEADQPENQLDYYVTKLNTILSQKAPSILQLQTQFAHFQK
ncbi:hypothetical protein Droror1_Dr00020304 [Drosera rotundifolia]